MRSWVVKSGFLIMMAVVMGGCGQSHAPRPDPNAVAQVTLTVSSPSLIAGQVVQLTPGAFNFGGSAVTTGVIFSFNSSNTAVATVSPQGLV